MKKTICIALLVCMAALMGAAAAEVLPVVMNRSLPLQVQTGNNPLIPGESPTTGLPKASDEYTPILCQIDNNKAALPQWGIADADIMYEMPIQGQGWTRYTALFSDKYPQEAGPVRSGRVMHADLREEWDAMFLFYGKQEDGGSDLRKALRDYGVNSKGLAIDGIGNKYEPYFQRVRKKTFQRSFYHKAPHNVTAYVSRIHDEVQMPLGYTYPVRPFLFTDELPVIGTEANRVNIIHKNNPDTASSFVYNPATNAYTRHTNQGPYVDLLYSPDQPLEYANVIVQRTRLTFNGHSMNPLLPDVVGQGAAEIFTGGRYIPGAWTRLSTQGRTVFYDSNGNEIKLQRGKTWICIGIEKTIISIDGNTSDLSSFFVEAEKNLKINPLEKEDIDNVAALNRQAVQQNANYITGPQMNIGFQFAKADSKQVVQYYTPIRLDGFEPTVYAFNDKDGETQFRVFGKVPGGTLGFYSVSVSASALDPSKPYDVKITSDRYIKDAKVFSALKAQDLDPSQVPEGFTKATGTGLYSFTNVFGKPEVLAYATSDGTNFAWYFVNVRRPLAGSPEVDMDDVKERMQPADGTVYQLPADMKAGYARAVRVKLSDGSIAVVYTDFPKINLAMLTKK